ncbi:MAG: N-acyl homoserine lactonase family protein [Negativicutes bacterium]
MATDRVYFLDAGYLYIDKSILTAGRGYGEIMKSSLYMTLLSHSDGWVLIDTGLNPAGLIDPESAWGPRAKIIRPIITPNNDIRVHLDKLGLRPTDIKYVINTHLHWDHTGSNALFKHATYYVQKSEYRYAFCPDAFSQPSYMAGQFDCGIDYKLVEGDVEILDNIFLLHTPGHTPGHQSVLVKLASGKNLIIAGDAVYTNENFNENIPPGNSWCQAASYSSINKLKLLQRLTNARVLPSHDPEIWSEISAPPSFMS